MQDLVNRSLLWVGSFALDLGREKLFCFAAGREGRLLVGCSVLPDKQYALQEEVTKDVVCWEMVSLPVTFYVRLPLPNTDPMSHYFKNTSNGKYFPALPCARHELE